MRNDISHTQLASALKLRPASERGVVDHGWLKAAHSFSFADYFDRNHMRFESIRVINDDEIAAGKGFPTHPHKDAEIFSYVLEGALEHKDSMGNGSVASAGGIQYMSAGSGVQHSEFNPSSTQKVRLLQVWLLPNQKGGQPHYDTLDIPENEKDGKLKLFLSPDGRDGSMQILADANIYAATLTGDQSISTELKKGRKAWIQMAKGSLIVNAQKLNKGDGLAISDAGRIEFSNANKAEFLFFDLGKI